MDPETGDPKLFFFAPPGVKVQFNRATESPPPVHVTYAPETSRAIPYRFAVPLGIIVFAAGAMLVLLVSRGHGSAAEAPRDVALTRGDVSGLAANNTTELAPAPVTVADIEPRQGRAALGQAVEAAASAVAEDSAQPAAASAVPVIFMDIPANDSLAAAVGKPTRSSEDKALERKSNPSKMHYDDPD